MVSILCGTVRCKYPDPTRQEGRSTERVESNRQGAQSDRKEEYEGVKEASCEARRLRASGSLRAGPCRALDQLWIGPVQ
ncbi:hypothetical protein MA16_Dca022012 [Dendrobium catenatum]|uniref:Uncharacterized protein n=1 Tax=Dendrobium catenatum TaxID=906689 RepID=A0A2I0X6A2_9ASPA|nr:hypothetical protein MA16_Dca022012 [Dendrobium catenatum]